MENIDVVLLSGSARDRGLHNAINTTRAIAIAIFLRRLPKEAVSRCGSRAVLMRMGSAESTILSMPLLLLSSLT